VLERDLALSRNEVRRIGALGHEGIGVDEIEDALGAGAGLLRHRHHSREEPHRSQQLDEIGGEREEGADADLALDRQPAAEREHAHLPECWDGL
jgi:hypothetical protein